MATGSNLIPRDQTELCFHCHNKSIPSNRSRYCSEDCLRAAARIRSRELKRIYRKNGDTNPNDYWETLGTEARKTYFRNYMRAYRAKRRDPNPSHPSSTQG